MNTKFSFIPKDWMVEHFEFVLFSKLEKTEVDIFDHEVNFVSLIELENNKSLSSLPKTIHSLNQIKNGDNDNHAMVIKLAGRFYSLDEFKLKEINADATSIQLLITHINVENQDGVPFLVTPVLIVPLNSTVIKRKKIIIEFEATKRDFITGKEQKDILRSIAKIDFSFDV